MILHNEDELHELNNQICETFVVRSAINDLLLISETEHADLAFQGWPQAENEEGTEVDRRLGWVSELRYIEWPLTFVGTSSGEYERKQKPATTENPLYELTQRMVNHHQAADFPTPRFALAALITGNTREEINKAVDQLSLDLTIDWRDRTDIDSMRGRASVRLVETNPEQTPEAYDEHLQRWGAAQKERSS
jgi:hypothetical protein